MRYTTKRNGKNVIPLLNAVCGLDMPYWRIDRADDLHSYLSGDAADKLAAYEDAEEQGRLVIPHWIPVTERLPEKQDKYLCVLKSHNREQSRYQNILIWCDGYFYEDGVGTMRVTHWMPLPQPPKEVEE